MNAAVLYGIFAPVLTVMITIIVTPIYKQYYTAPLATFIGLNIVTIVLPMFTGFGWQALFGWSLFYALFSFIITVAIMKSRNKGNPAP